jgi:hypothetical protein
VSPTHRLPAALLRTALLALAVQGALWTAGCEPTPAFLQQWANTPGSEDKFAGYLQNPRSSPEVRLKALELLIAQWSHSATLFRDGQVLRQMPDPAGRDAVIRGVIPYLQARMDDERTTAITRDAIMQIRRGTDNAEVIAQLDAILLQWLQTRWAPCVQVSGATPIGALFSTLPEAEGAAILGRVLREGPVDDVICLVANIRNVAWLTTNVSLAESWVHRMENGPVPEHPQQARDFLEWGFQMGALPVLREFYFRRLSDPATTGDQLNFFLDALERHQQPDDQERYLALLQSPTTLRWAAMETIINLGGSDGLQSVLQNLPADGDYRSYAGEMLEDGFQQSARNIACNITRLGTLGDFARQAFERAAQGTNPAARALSLTCLERFGNARTVTALASLLTSLGAEPVPTPPGYAGLSVQQLAAQTVTAIEARLAAPPTP